MSELVKPGSIVKDKTTGLVYQLIGTIGNIAKVKGINAPYEESAIFVSDLEVIMDETGEAFEVLFGTNDDT